MAAIINMRLLCGISYAAIALFVSINSLVMLASDPAAEKHLEYYPPSPPANFCSPCICTPVSSTFNEGLGYVLDCSQLANKTNITQLKFSNMHPPYCIAALADNAFAGLSQCLSLEIDSPCFPYSVSYLNIPSFECYSFRGLSSLENLTINTQASEVTFTAGAFACSGLANLTSLVLNCYSYDGCPVSINSAAFVGLSNLRSLSFFGYNINPDVGGLSQPDFVPFLGLTNLQNLVMANLDPTGFALNSFFGLSNLIDFTFYPPNEGMPCFTPGCGSTLEPCSSYIGLCFFSSRWQQMTSTLGIFADFFLNCAASC